MENIKKKFGFGCMRLPMKNGEVDTEQTCRMVDAFLENGFNYFDTAHGYLNGKSEGVLKTCLTSRYPRDRYVLTDKLTNVFFKKQEDIRPLFQSQLEACGVEYFDFYLMHAQGTANFAHFKQCRAYETALELKAEGKIRHFGISFHDRADVLEQILTEYPQVEVVQIQFNYLDYEDPAVESRKCYEVCRKYGKPVIVMEPVKGGHLANLPERAQAVLDELGGGSAASYAIRYAAGFEGILMVLSGMSSMEQMTENIRFMKDFRPLDDREMAAIEQVREIYHSMNLIPCTACRYCVAGCPRHISIPNLLAIMNTKHIHRDWNADYYYNVVHTGGEKGKASDCIQCGNCEKACPQHLPIRKLLADVAKEFEKQGERRMAKLVVFYSRADENYFGGQCRFVEVGNTEKVARIIAEATGAQLFKIEQKQPYSPDYKRCIDQAMADKRANARPELVEPPENLDGYDEIYLGYPNYWGDMPMAVYTFLEAFDWSGKTIHPFCTHEGSGLSGTERNIARTCKGADVKTGLAICGSDVDGSKDLVLRWLA